MILITQKFKKVIILPQFKGQSYTISFFRFHTFNGSNYSTFSIWNICLKKITNQINYSSITKLVRICLQSTHNRSNNTNGMFIYRRAVSWKHLGHHGNEKYSHAKRVDQLLLRRRGMNLSRPGEEVRHLEVGRSSPHWCLRRRSKLRSNILNAIKRPS